MLAYEELGADWPIDGATTAFNITPSANLRLGIIDGSDTTTMPAIDIGIAPAGKTGDNVINIGNSDSTAADLTTITIGATSDIAEMTVAIAGGAGTGDTIIGIGNNAADAEITIGANVLGVKNIHIADTPLTTPAANTINIGIINTTIGLVGAEVNIATSTTDDDV